MVKGQLSSALLSICPRIAQQNCSDWHCQTTGRNLLPKRPIPMYLTNDLKHLKLFNNCETKPIALVYDCIEMRSKHAVSSSLDNIPGIGEKTIIKLLKVFKSVKRIKEAELKDLVQRLERKSKELYSHFHPVKERRNKTSHLTF